MKLYGAECDSTYITLYAKDNHDAMCLLLEEGNNLGLDINWKSNEDQNSLYIQWTDTQTEDITITEIKTTRGIVAVESH